MVNGKLVDNRTGFTATSDNVRFAGKRRFLIVRFRAARTNAENLNKFRK